MRLATLYDTVSRKATPVFVLPGGERIGLIDAVHYAPAGSSDDYFNNIAEVAGHLDVVLPAISSWRSSRPSQAGSSAKFPWKFLPPIPNPRSFRDFMCFEQHVKTCRARVGQQVPSPWYDAPSFYFGNAGALVGHDWPVCAPKSCSELDFEMELGIVIGRGGRDIRARDAWKHVAGFTIVNDFSARDIQRREMTVGLGPAKGKDFATAVGPYLVTLDDLADRIDSHGKVHLGMIAKLNGQIISKNTSATMHFTWPQVIEHASRDAELFPGDLIASGTVGNGCILELGPESTGGWLKPGDVVELEIERLGTLRTPIVDRPDAVQTLSQRRDDALVGV